MSELSSGYCHCHLKCVSISISRVQTENCTIDKQSPYIKLLLFSKRVLLVIVSETVEWAIAMLVAPLELYCVIVSGYYLSFKLSGKVVFSLGTCIFTVVIYLYFLRKLVKCLSYQFQFHI